MPKLPLLPNVPFDLNFVICLIGSAPMALATGWSIGSSSGGWLGSTIAGPSSASLFAMTFTVVLTIVSEVLFTFWARKFMQGDSEDEG